MADLPLTVAAIADGASLDTAAQAAAVGGDTAPVGPYRLLYVDNAGAAPITATIATPGTVKGLAVGEGTLTVAAGDSGVLPLSRVYAGANGRAAITYDDVTSVTVAAIELEH